jgi:hypothetical protein
VKLLPLKYFGLLLVQRILIRRMEVEVEQGAVKLRYRCAPWASPADTSASAIWTS